LLEELGLSLLSGVVDPAIVIGFNVAPSRFEFIPEIPEELALEDLIEDFFLTVSKLVHLIEIEMA